MSVFVCAVTAGTVLAINFMLTMWASIRYGLNGGLATLQEGSCQKTKSLSLWLHLAINILSTVLLSASNYCMQCLASPTREEVDRAHRRRIWLDIGVPSVRNLRQISWYKIVLWWLLALSGIPLHLLYNSAVFSSLAAVEYTVYAGSGVLVAGVGVDWSTPLKGTTLTLQTLQNASAWQRLENKDCITAYGQPFVSAHGDLLAITPDLNSSVPAIRITDSGLSVSAGSSGAPYDGICATTERPDSPNCDLNRILKQPSSWTLSNVTDNQRSLDFDFHVASSNITVDHCLSRPVEERCRLQFSLVIMCVVIGCNLMKMICMLLTLFYHRSQPLVTLGDAINSFLLHRDPITENMCLASKKTFLKGGWRGGAEIWQTTRHRWFSAASVKRWLTCNIL